jgi:hypothetical protein
MWLFLVLSTLIGWLAPAAQAATYYVNQAGNDTNPGTSSLPVRTIKKGISILHPGDTLIISKLKSLQVPEPSTLALAILGAGLVGIAARRRKISL